MAPRTRVERVDRLRKKLQALPPRARTEIKKAIQKGAEEISSTAKRLAPVDDSDLRNSIGYRFGQARRSAGNVVSAQDVGDPDLSAIVFAGDEKAFYAAMVEFGTKPHPQGGQYAGTMHPGNPAQPYFFPAYRLLKKRVLGRITRATRKSARDVAKAGRA